jgi:hypothetical protein
MSSSPPTKLRVKRRTIPQNSVLGEQEYAALRDEVLKRLEFRNQMLSVLLVVAGTFISVGTQAEVSATVLLVYPLLALFLISSWIHNGRALVLIGRYLREEVEKRHSGLGWEKYLKRPQIAKSAYGHFNNFAMAGLALTTQALATGLATTKLTGNTMENILLVVSLVSTAVTGLLILYHIQPVRNR